MERLFITTLTMFVPKLHPQSHPFLMNHLSPLPLPLAQLSFDTPAPGSTTMSALSPCSTHHLMSEDCPSCLQSYIAFAQYVTSLCMSACMVILLDRCYLMEIQNNLQYRFFCTSYVANGLKTLPMLTRISGLLQGRLQPVGAHLTYTYTPRLPVSPQFTRGSSAGVTES